MIRLTRIDATRFTPARGLAMTRFLLMLAAPALALIAAIPVSGRDPVPAPVQGDALMDTLVDLEKRSWEAWQRRDGTFFESFLSDDHVEIGGLGIDNKAGVVAGVNSPACVVNHYQVDHFAMTRLNQTTALLTYHAAQETTCGGQPVPSPAWAGSLYLRRGDRWVNVVYQQSASPR
jgi:hypothetical protein